MPLPSVMCRNSIIYAHWDRCKHPTSFLVTAMFLPWSVDFLFFFRFSSDRFLPFLDFPSFSPSSQCFTLRQRERSLQLNESPPPPSAKCYGLWKNCGDFSRDAAFVGVSLPFQTDTQCSGEVCCTDMCVYCVKVSKQSSLIHLCLCQQCDTCNPSPLSTMFHGNNSLYSVVGHTANEDALTLVPQAVQITSLITVDPACPTCYSVLPNLVGENQASVPFHSPSPFFYTDNRCISVGVGYTSGWFLFVRQVDHYYLEMMVIKFALACVRIGDSCPIR